MTFKETRENPLGDLVEIASRMVESNDACSAEIFVTARFAPEEVELKEFTVQIGFLRAHLIVEPFGSQTDPHAKYGMRVHDERVVKEGEVRERIKATVSRSVAKEAILQGKFDPVHQGLDASARKSKQQSQSTELEMERGCTQRSEYIPVEAQGNDKWVVTAEDGQVLNGFYLNDSRLCRLIKNEGIPNRFGASLTIEMKKKDISITVAQNRRFWRMEPNREKVLAALVAERLQTIGHHRSDQIITFAKSEIEHEG